MSGTTQESPTEPKPWLCGDPFKYPIPEENGSPWETLLRPLLEQDKVQCDGWNDEVQNLLIFAGLFSAVLTAFVIESYKNLQPDPNDRIIALLSQISAEIQTQGQASNMTLIRPTSGPTEAFSPTPSSVRINAFWFTSLVLSLTTVLIGIVGLQWIREHKKYSGRVSPRTKFAIFHMRAEALQKWHVADVFSALPVLLQFSLLLFFAGLVDFVLPYGIQISLPVIVAIGIPVGFLFLTTITPALQAFVFVAPITERVLEVPSQCPYKSPQSRAFRRFVFASRTIFRVCVSLSHFLQLSVAFLLFRLTERLRNFSPSSFVYRSVLTAWKGDSWETYDESWVNLRDAYAQCIFNDKEGVKGGEFYLSLAVAPVYDITKGIQRTPPLLFTGKYPASYTLYHCVAEISDAIASKSPWTVETVEVHQFSIVRYNWFFQNILMEGVNLRMPQETLSSQMSTYEIKKPQLGILRDENCLIFLNGLKLSPAPDPLSLTTKHCDELNLRLANTLSLQQSVLAFSVLLSEREWGDWMFMYIDSPYFIKYKWPPSFSPDFDSSSDFTVQSNFALTHFFQVLADLEVDAEILLRSFLNQNQIPSFVELACGRQSSQDIGRLLELISAKMMAFSQGNPGKREDLFFYCAALYAKSCISSSQSRGDLIAVGIVKSFLPTLNIYLDRRGIPEDVACFRIPADTSDSWWDELLRPHPISDNTSSSAVPFDLLPLENRNNGRVFGKLFPYLNRHKSGSPV